MAAWAPGGWHRHTEVTKAASILPWGSELGTLGCVCQITLFTQLNSQLFLHMDTQVFQSHTGSLLLTTLCSPNRVSDIKLFTLHSVLTSKYHPGQQLPCLLLWSGLPQLVSKSFYQTLRIILLSGNSGLFPCSLHHAKPYGIQEAKFLGMF